VVALTPVPEGNYAFREWSITEENEADLDAVPLSLTMDQDWTVEPIFDRDPHTLTVNITPEGEGRIAFSPDPINGEDSAARRVEHFNPFREDKTVTLQAVEVLENDYRFDHWVGGSIDGLTDHEVTFELTDDTDVSAVFIPAFALSIQNLGGHGVNIDPPDRDISEPYGLEFYPDPAHDGSITEAVVVTITPQISDFLHFDHWIVDAVPVYNTGPLTVTMDQARDVKAVFLPAGTPNGFDFQLLAAVNGEGTIHLEHTAPHEDRDTEVIDTFEEMLTGGTQVTATATPGSGLVFDYWLRSTDSGTVVETGSLPVITTDTAILANFRESGAVTQKSVTLEQHGLGYVEPSLGVTRYEPGTPVKFIAMPAPGWRFVEWVGGPSNDEADVTITINDDMDVVAYFEPEGEWNGIYTGAWYNLEMEASMGGSVLPGASRFPAGAEIPITAVPDEGWRFHHWEGDLIDGSENASEVCAMSNHVYLRAIFEPVIEIVVPAPGVLTGGLFTISPEKPEGYRLGDEITLTPVPDGGWQFDRWVGDVSTESLSRSYSVRSSAQSTYSEAEEGEVTTVITSAPFNVRPIFSPITFGMEIHSTGKGRIHNASGKNRFRAGDGVKLVALADADWEFQRWEADISSPETDEILEFSMPEENVEVRAIFVRAQGKTYGISIEGWLHEDMGTWIASAGSPVVFAPMGPDYSPGSRVTLVATDIPGYTFSHWSGDIAGASRTYTIESIERDMEVTPVYSRQATEVGYDTLTVFALQSAGGIVSENLVIADPAPISVTYHEIPPNSLNPPHIEHIVCNSSRYTAHGGIWYMKYAQPMPEVNLSISGATQILVSNTIVGSNTVTIKELPSNSCIQSSPQSPRQVYLAALLDLDILEGRMNYDTYQCVQTGGTLAGCGYEYPCNDYDFYEYIDSDEWEYVYHENSINLGPEGYIAMEGFIFENGTYTSVAGASKDYEGDPLIFHLSTEYGWRVAEDNSAPSSTGGSDVEVTFEPTDDTRFIATSVQPSNTGNVTGSREYGFHETVTLEANARPGYDFAYWKKPVPPNSGPSIDVPFAFNNPLTLGPCFLGDSLSEHYIAVFEPSCTGEYPLESSVEGNGVIVVSEHRALYDCDESVVLRAVPDAGYDFVRWEGDVTGSTNPFTVPMTTAKSVTAVFRFVGCDNVDVIAHADADGDGVLSPYTSGPLPLKNVPAFTFTREFGTDFLTGRAEELWLETNAGAGVLDTDVFIEIEREQGSAIQFYASRNWAKEFYDGDPFFYHPSLIELRASQPLGNRFELAELSGGKLYMVAWDAFETRDPSETRTETVILKTVRYGVVCQEISVDIELRNAPVPHNAVVLVGRNQNPKIPKHEWDDFYQHAQYWKRKYDSTHAGDAYVFEVRDVTDVRFALEHVKDIGELTTFAHGGQQEVYLDDTNVLDAASIATLNLENIAEENVVFLYTCYAGAGEINIAGAFANGLSSPVWATSTGCNYGLPIWGTNIRFFPHTPRNLGFGLDGIYRWFYPAEE